MLEKSSPTLSEYKATLGTDEVIVCPSTEKVTYAEILPDLSIKEYVEPTIQFTKWNKEETLSIIYENTQFSDKTLVDGELRLTAENEQFYYKQADTDLMKFGLILPKPPDKKPVLIDGIEYYQWSFKLVGWENFDFFYQPPLKNINPDGSTWEYDDEINKKGLCFRSAEMSGGWVIYHKTKINNKYATGQFGTIAVIKLISSDGRVIKLSPEINNGIYTINAPINLIKDFKYPLKFNDQFGLNTVGASTFTDCSDYFEAVIVTNAPAGQITKVYIAEKVSTGTSKARVALYTDVSGTCTALISNTDSGEMTLSRTTDPTSDLSTWLQADIASGFTLVATTTYWIAFNNTTHNSTIYYNTVASANGYATNSYTLFPNATAPALNTQSRRYSVCYEYTAGGGGGIGCDLTEKFIMFD